MKPAVRGAIWDLGIVGPQGKQRQSVPRAHILRCSIPREIHSMGDDKSKKGAADRSRININERYELDYWTKELGVTPDRVNEPVASWRLMFGRRWVNSYEIS